MPERRKHWVERAFGRVGRFVHDTSALAIVLFVLAALALITGFVTHQLRVDRCLDAGGRFDHELGRCER